jgi:cellulose synthase/poly-beta-1,6-N-acetylglucosamine synthase-like glycosyltransferase
MIALLRLTAVWHAVRRTPQNPDPSSFDRRYVSRLPTFSVLLPLYRERRVVPGLVSAMRRLDYPVDRLEILFITEADDHMTRRALLAAGLPANMRIVTVPKGQPRTKPRALNYALQDARGTLVAVFDAEDIPDQSQLRRAAEAFIEGGSGTPLTSPKMPTSASGWRALATRCRSSIQKRWKRRRRRGASGLDSARVGLKVGYRRISSICAVLFASGRISAPGDLLAFK